MTREQQSGNEARQGNTAGKKRNGFFREAEGGEFPHREAIDRQERGRQPETRNIALWAKEWFVVFLPSLRLREKTKKREVTQ